MNTRLWDVYQMPQGDWAFAAAGRISDGYESERSAMETCIDDLCIDVIRLARMAEAGTELWRTGRPLLDRIGRMNLTQDLPVDEVTPFHDAIVEYEEASRAG